MLAALDAARSRRRRRCVHRRPGRRGRAHRARTRPARPRRRRPRRPVAGRRSRNDQIATLIRMYLRDEARALARRGARARSTRCAGQADRHLGVAMPGRTHLQHAQPVLLSHHLLAHCWALGPRRRPAARLGRPRGGVSPYGSGALAGSSLGLDPHAVAAGARIRRCGRELDRRDRQSVTSSPSSRSSRR